ncbi:hypothetical protein M413DRAFT_445709 [Hebeloma cylindrosporum]|uniref:Uncharacterized protein n=1 Tax=Hebeloma cylindrosporum TaxID=76867 RepID=A0A0C3C9N7_HEBCY|nr:hypothetical protein M413DRAFT_445709 [Hebeloma cylindrosporum h7]
MDANNRTKSAAKAYSCFVPSLRTSSRRSTSIVSPFSPVAPQNPAQQLLGMTHWPTAGDFSL